MNSDRPLSDAQERALIVLADCERALPGTWHNVRKVMGRWSPATMWILSERGLVKLSYSYRLGTWVAKITPKGLALCNSMGD